MINSAHCAASCRNTSAGAGLSKVVRLSHPNGVMRCAYYALRAKLPEPGQLLQRLGLLDSLAAPRAISLPGRRRWTHVASRANIRPNLRPKRQRRRSLMNITVGRQAIAEASEKLKNWGRWGEDDQIGTLNHIRPEDIVKAAALIKTGKVFGLGIPLDRKGPQTGLFGGRWNPLHTMLATGTDTLAGRPA